ncbi:ATP-dependent RNA helicase DBP9 [Tremella mesenterica]|uniref:RNA helicase n=1 Tax=Tremella mesenterica TaxID=5217 RepID=A0A4Q1BN07_TREME|nr:ATP-dependent RNA helicase DBP9 [Tremella mesenterica]
MAPTDPLLESEQLFSQPPFSTLLDARILRALADLSFAHPTLVQAKAIPLLLEGKDVLAKARTGSGKTAAYAVPALQKILDAKETLSPASENYQVTRSLILVPTRELSLQVTKFITSLLAYSEHITIYNASSSSTLRADSPDIIVSTPSRLLTLLESRQVDLTHLVLLVIDEADLVLSYGHKEELQRLCDPNEGWIPRLGVQGCLMSATLGEEVQSIKGMILHNPAILTLSEPTSSLLTQYYTHTSERDKFLLLYVLLKLKLIRGKSIVFVNTVDRGYMVKLFLEQFGIKSCVVNAELPLGSRYHVVEEFNRGVYDVIVATDEVAGDGEPPEEESQSVEAELDEGAEEGGEGNDAAEEVAEERQASSSKRKVPPPLNNRKRQKRQKDPASSLARGIDFTSASSVINFDLPTNPTAYMHRVGRTARAGHSGLSLSFIVSRSKWSQDKLRQVSLSTAEHDEEVWERILYRVSKEGGGEMKEWDWGGRKSEIDGFRYRMEDALKSVTTKRVQDARREEVRRELLNSEKLKAHFAANPLDLNYLRHDAPLHPARIQSHLKHVPSYLMPKVARPFKGDISDGTHVNFARGKYQGKGRGRGGRKKMDPLKFKS